MDDWELEETRQTIDGGNTGTVLAGRYRIVRQLGQGGMGSVWLAEDQQLDNRRVAIKMLPSILIANKRAYAQLKSEALVSLKLVHSNIVALRAFEENDGNPFLVMDYVEGRTLDDYLAEKGTLSEEETVRILKPVADALDYAHGKGVVHRDVKPANVMLGKDGTPYVLDFGIAREIQETMTRVTGKSSSGTLLYMSPEQLKGGSPAAQQDVYSFAAMAYECLKGTPPFSRGQVEYQILNETPQPLPSGIGIAALVMAGLSKTPEGRPATCAAVLDGTRQQSHSVDSRGGTGAQPGAESPHGTGPQSGASVGGEDLLSMGKRIFEGWKAGKQGAVSGLNENLSKIRQIFGIRQGTTPPAQEEDGFVPMPKLVSGLRMVGNVLAWLLLIGGIALALVSEKVDDVDDMVDAWLVASPSLLLSIFFFNLAAGLKRGMKSARALACIFLFIFGGVFLYLLSSCQTWFAWMNTRRSATGGSFREKAILASEIICLFLLYLITSA
ncbi:MAG: serine/threonine protein kinase [Kiritimatiellae bacterium]|nr:serine/threonine protein kinase [Kiritimatiellia bacterium]